MARRQWVGEHDDRSISLHRPSTGESASPSRKHGSLNSATTHAHQLITDVAHYAILAGFHWEPLLAHPKVTDNFSTRTDFESSFTVFLEQLYQSASVFTMRLN